MADKKRFVEGDILDPDDGTVRQLDDLVHQQKREAVRKSLFDLLGGEYRGLIRIVNGGILEMLVLLDVLLDLFGKFHVGGVTGPVGDDMPLDREADKSQVANDVQQLVPGRLIGKAQFQVVEITFAFDLYLIAFEGFCKTTHLFGRNRFVYHYDSVVDVTAFDQVILNQ